VQPQPPPEGVKDREALRRGVAWSIERIRGHNRVSKRNSWRPALEYAVPRLHCFAVHAATVGIEPLS
jgi:hypothetical protein